MSAGEETNRWQRRYDESLAQQAAMEDTDDGPGTEHVALEASGCIPGRAGTIAVGLTVAVVFVGRLVRRARKAT
jgi:hypothetical protein